MLRGEPLQLLMPADPVQTVALSGADFPGIRPEFRKSTEEKIRAGETVFVDRKRPEIAFVSPVAGRIAQISFGRRRMLEAVVIECDGDDAIEFDVRKQSGGRGWPRRLLQQAGLWTAFLTRPFGRIPDPDSSAEAIFVTAIDTHPLAPDPMVAIERQADHFLRGAIALEHLTRGPVHICHAADRRPAIEEGGRIRLAGFAGRHPAGLPGTHIHHLAPAGTGHTVWQIGYQDVIAIGHLLATRSVQDERIIAVAGSGVTNPGLMLVKAGTSLDELLAGETRSKRARIISGPVLSGRDARFLGRYHNQVTVLSEGDEPRVRTLSGRVARFAGGTASRGIVPAESFERALPLDILPVPLMRALSVGDVESARDLGCLELLEEDLALISHLCTTGTDYGILLRRVLNELAGAYE